MAKAVYVKAEIIILDSKIYKYIDRWELSNSEKIAETMTGSLFKVDSSHAKTVLKIFTEVGLKDESGGTTFLKNTSGKGSIQLLSSDQGAQLLEYLPGPDLYQFSKNGKEDQATDIFIEIIKNIQIFPIEFTDELLPLKKIV